MQHGWIFTLGLAALAVVGAVLASRADLQRNAQAAADPCFRYGRFECCLRPDE